MNLIKEIESILDKKGKKVKMGLFLCSYCLQKVIKQLYNGKRDKSCGCQKYILIGKSNSMHGESETKLYKKWLKIKERCLNKKDISYKNYGGRGITICPEWTDSYIAFRDWSLNNGYQEGLEIDRIDNNGNYEPKNCHFITKTENLRNTRTTKISIQIANEIREMYKTGKYSQYYLAKKYNVTRPNIGYIINNKTWRTG